MCFKLISILSETLSEVGVYHKIDGKFIVTKKSKVKIPKMSEDVAYLIGVIAGDGSLNKTIRLKGGYHYTLRIYAAGQDYLNRLNNIINKNFEISGKIVKDNRKINAYNLIFRNAPIFFYFAILGNEIGKKKRFEIPKSILEDRDYFLEYLAGLTDTDGHISRKRIQLKQKSKKLLRQIKVLADKEGLNCSEPKVNYTNKKPYYYIRFDNRLPLRFKKAYDRI